EGHAGRRAPRQGRYPWRHSDPLHGHGGGRQTTVKRFSPGTLLAIALLFVALLPLAGLAWYYLYSLEQMLAATTLQNVASIAVDDLEPFLRQQRNSLLIFAAVLLVSALVALGLGRRFLRSERIIAAQEARYRAMFGSMNDGVAIYRPVNDGEAFIVLDINPAGERIAGIARATVLG